MRRLRERVAGGAQRARVVLVGHEDQQVLGRERRHLGAQISCHDTICQRVRTLPRIAGDDAIRRPAPAARPAVAPRAGALQHARARRVALLPAALRRAARRVARDRCAARGHGRISANQISQWLHTDKAWVGRSVERLIAAGYVRRRPDPDARAPAAAGADGERASALTRRSPPRRAAQRQPAARAYGRRSARRWSASSASCRRAPRRCSRPRRRVLEDRRPLEHMEEQ